MRKYIMIFLLGTFVCLGSGYLHGISANFEFSVKSDFKSRDRLGRWLFLNNSVKKVTSLKQFNDSIILLEPGGEVGILDIPEDGLDVVIVEEAIEIKEYKVFSCRLERRYNELEVWINRRLLVFNKESIESESAIVLKAQEGTRLYIISKPILEFDLSLDAYAEEIIAAMTEVGCLRGNRKLNKNMNSFYSYQKIGPMANKMLSVKILEVKQVRGAE